MFKIWLKNSSTKDSYNNDPVGCLGKLPIHNEFIKHGINLPELAHLDQWYQSAHRILSQNYGRDVKQLFLQMPHYHYVYYTNNNINPIIGNVMPSQDLSGRIYPYVVFRILENPLAREFFSTIPIMYADYFAAVYDICLPPWDNKLLPNIFTQINVLNKTANLISRRTTLETCIDLLKKFPYPDKYPDQSSHY